VTLTQERAAPAGAAAGKTGAAPQTAEAVLETILTRRSAPGWLPDEPDRETIDRLLDAANRAPNHGLTQPWRFFVLRGDARLAYAAAVAEDQISDHLGKQLPTPDGWDDQCRQAAAHSFLRAPIVVAVYSVSAQRPNLPDWEELCATAAAVQNFLLAAHAFGLGAAWKSRACPLPGAAKFLGLPDHAQLAGHILLGYADPAVPLKPKDRRPVQTLTTWLGWDDR
jgi:nitroreductase